LIDCYLKVEDKTLNTLYKYLPHQQHLNLTYGVADVQLLGTQNSWS